MKTLLFTKTGEKQVLGGDITVFSDRIRVLPDKCLTIVLKDIQTKHCAIIKEDQIYKIIDFCSFDTKLFINGDIRPKLLKPLTFYELRDSDTIFIGEHEIVFRSEPEITDKPSFYIPETQDVQQNLQKQDTVIDDVDHIEIPETQVDTQDDMVFDSQMLTEPEEPARTENLKSKLLQSKEYLVETQHHSYKSPPKTRRYTAKQNLIKPKTVPMVIFDYDTQKEAETQPLTLPELMDDKPKPKKVMLKRKSDPAKSFNRILKNSVLLSDSDSDSDYNCSRISAVSVKYANRTTSEAENSLSFSINDDFDMPYIQSPDINSQFLERVNASCSDENMGLILNTEEPIVKAEIKKESTLSSILTKKKSDNDFKPQPRKKIKLFKYDLSDEDEMC